MTRSCAGLLGICLAAAGCAHVGVRKATPDGGPLAAKIDRVARRVAELRGLALTAPLEFESLDAATFSARLRGHVKADAVDEERALWVAFGFAPPDVDAHRLVAEVLDEQVAAFYDPRRQVLELRDQPAASVGGAAKADDDMLLAHEIQHALQDRHFHLGSAQDRHLDDDAELARAALVEGDATGVMVAYAAKDVGDILTRTTQAMRELPPQAIVALSGHSPALTSAPALLREQMLFPYLVGLGFVADLHRTGGFALVDRVFGHYPASSEQVLHVEKYLAGEAPIVVGRPATPRGWRELTHGTLGEVGIRAFLQECLDLPAATHAAAGWGGDNYTVVEKGGRLALLWSTAWDDAVEAAEFAAALGDHRPCFIAANQKRGVAGSIGDHLLFEVEGNRVAVVRADAADTTLLAPHPLLALVGPTLAPAPPLGDVHLVAAPLARKDSTSARLDSGHYVSDRLAVEARVPDGFASEIDTRPGTGAGRFSVQRQQPSRAVGSFLFASAAGSTSIDQLLDVVGASFGGMLAADRKVKRGGDALVDTGLGSGQSRLWTIDTSGTISVTVVPACGGKGLYLFMQAWQDEAGRAGLATWLTSFRQTTSPPPACADFAP